MKFWEYAEKHLDRFKFPIVNDTPVPSVPIHVPPVLFEAKDFIVTNIDKTYKFHPSIERFLYPVMDDIKSFFKQHFYNGNLVRLEDIQGARIEVSEVYYFEHRTIHHDPDRKYYKKGPISIRDMFEERMMYEVERGILKTSYFPNGLGMNVFVITEDGYLVLSKRSKDVSVEKKKYAPTFSTGIPYYHVPGQIENLIERTLEAALLREFNYPVFKNDKFFYLGTARGLYTMGCPDMYFIAFINNTLDYFSEHANFETKSFAAVRLVDKPWPLKEKADRIVKGILETLESIDRNEASVQLYVNAALANTLPEVLKKGKVKTQP